MVDVLLDCKEVFSFEPLMRRLMVLTVIMIKQINIQHKRADILTFFSIHLFCHVAEPLDYGLVQGSHSTQLRSVILV